MEKFWFIMAAIFAQAYFGQALQHSFESPCDGCGRSSLQEDDKELKKMDKLFKKDKKLFEGLDTQDYKKSPSSAIDEHGNMDEGGKLSPKEMERRSDVHENLEIENPPLRLLDEEGPHADCGAPPMPPFPPVLPPGYKIPEDFRCPDPNVSFHPYQSPTTPKPSTSSLPDAS